MHRQTSIAVALLISLLVVSCGGKPAVVKPSNQTAAVTNAQTERQNEYYKVLAEHFSRKFYVAPSHVYGVNDLKAPREIWEALTNLNVNYLSLLREEIFARHGAQLTTEVSRKTIGATPWYKVDADFNMTKDPNKNEKKSYDYLRKMERIDVEGPEDARQLAIILNLPKEELTTDEAIKVYKATGNYDVLTSINQEVINDKKVLFKIKSYFDQKYIGNNTKVFKFTDNEINESRKMIYLSAKFIIGFNKGDRLLVNTEKSDLLIECIIHRINIKWGWISEPYGGGTSIGPDEGIAKIDKNGEIEFAKIVAKQGMPVTEWEQEEQNDISPFELKSDYIVYDGAPILPSCIDGNSEQHGYKYKKSGNSLYVLVPFNLEAEVIRRSYTKYLKELTDYAKKHNFVSGYKVFRIRILNKN